MEKSRLISMMFVSLCIGVVFFTGCAKKETVKSESNITDDAAAIAAKEKALRDKGQKEAALRALAAKDKEKAGITKESATQSNEALKDIHFDFNKYLIRVGDREVLQKIANYLLAKKNVKITIEGNCDERGTAEYNMALGFRRAYEAKKYIANLGVPKKRMKTISYGKEKPVDPGHDEEAWAKNRRDHFVINYNLSHII
jgi:peptidoglycan-associated lipoprotein